MSEFVYEFFDNMESSQPFTINELTIISNNAPANVFVNWHSHPEIIYAIEGEGSVLCENKLVPIKQGDIVFVNSEQYHDILTDKSLRFYYLVIYDDFLKQNGLDPSNTKFCNLIQSNTASQLFLKIVALKEKNDYYSNFEARCCILSFMLELYKNHIIDIDTKESDNINEMRIKDVIKYIKSHLTEKITLDRLSEHHNISKFYLSHEFKKYTGTSIIEYINVLRCINARALLKNAFSVQSAATASGFENMSYFTKTYKRVFGNLPSNDRNNI